jgi:diguanylate cyclase (GGDEF)-like protein
VVPAFIAATTAVAVVAACLTYHLPEPGPDAVRLPWWGLAVLFTVTQASVLNVQLRREARSVFLSEVPFLLGLLYVSVPGLFAARILGALVASAVFRRQFRSPEKLAFNTAVAAAEAAAGILTYRLVLWGGSPMTPHAWAAAIAGAVTACMLAALVVSLLIRALERLQRLSDVARTVGQAGMQAAVIAVIAVLVAASLAESDWAVVPLVVMTMVLVTAYRGYARLNERHSDLELLHGFTQAVTNETDVVETQHRLLAKVTELLHAEQARLTLHNAEHGSADDELVFRQGRVTASRPRHSPAHEDWVRERVCVRGESLLATRTTKDPAVQEWLSRHGLRETIVVPLRTEAGVFGMLAVDDRLGEARGFDNADLRFLETVANHVSITLHNGRLLDKLRHDALHDALTALPNRTFFQLELDKALDARSGGSCTVGILDLNAFKDVNDTLGHHQGDALLCEVSRRLTEAAGDRALIARFGGDEFAILAKDISNPDLANELADALVASLREPMVIADIEVPLGASVGLALAPLHGATSAALLRRADMAMYAAKELADGVKIFDAALDSTADTKLAMVSRLRRAIEQGDLDVYMQPKADLHTETIRSAEALLRWHDERGEWIPPDDFIPVAERAGLIRGLTALVLRRAVAACAEWQHDAPGVGVAVNLSARSLTDTGIVRLVEQVLEAHQLPAELLTLELTESSIMSDASRSLRLLEELRRLGVQLSVDDFGTGYSSLTYLRRFPVTEVKVDRSFVMRMAIDTEDAVIVKSIVDLAHNLRLQVVAEGIEDRATWTMLAQQGCDLGQGYHLARPMPAQDFAKWLRRRFEQNPRGRLSVVS